MPDIPETREERQRRIPLVRGQVMALTDAAVRSSQSAAGSPVALEAGHVLTSNMVAAFAIELSLKLFYMAFAPDAPRRKHELLDLFLGLPPEMQADIRATFEGNLREQPNVQVLAFRTSPTMPAPPSEVPVSLPFATAHGLLEQCSKLFVQARYFPEQVGDGWAMISHPLPYLLHMIDCLAAVFDGYLESGWRRGDTD